MLTRVNLQAVLKSLRIGYLNSSWLSVGLAILGWAIGNAIIFKIGGVFYSLLKKAVSEQQAMGITLAIGFFISASLFLLFFASLFLKADNFFWRDKTERLTIKLFRAFSTTGEILIILGGVTVVGWLIDVAIISRLLGEKNFFLGFIAAVLLFLPLLLRLWFLPATVSLMSDVQVKPLKSLIGATKGKGFHLLGVAALQAVVLGLLLLIGYLLGMQAIPEAYRDLLNYQGEYQEGVSAFIEQIKAISPVKFGIFFLISSPILAIFANMNTSTIRTLVGVGSSDRQDKHFNAFSKEEADFVFQPAEEDDVYVPKNKTSESEGSRSEKKRAPVAKPALATEDPFKGLSFTEKEEAEKKQDVLDGYDFSSEEEEEEAGEEEKPQLKSTLNLPDNQPVAPAFNPESIAEDLQNKPPAAPSRTTDNDIPDMPDSFYAPRKKK